MTTLCFSKPRATVLHTFISSLKVYLTTYVSFWKSRAKEISRVRLHKTKIKQTRYFKSKQDYPCKVRFLDASYFLRTQKTIQS